MRALFYIHNGFPGLECPQPTWTGASTDAHDLHVELPDNEVYWVGKGPQGGGWTEYIGYCMVHICSKECFMIYIMSIIRGCRKRLFISDKSGRFTFLVGFSTFIQCKMTLHLS